MSTFTWTPDFSASRVAKPAVTVVKFGDGYEQRAAHGINTLAKDWNLQFINRDNTETDAIDSFLQGLNAITSFDWTPPGESSALKYVCRTWDRQTVKYNLNNITAVFEQVFEP